MTFQHFANLAAACTNMVALEKLFIDERKFVVDNAVPPWQYNRVWTENRARIEGDGLTGECLEEWII